MKQSINHKSLGQKIEQWISNRSFELMLVSSLILFFSVLGVTKASINWDMPLLLLAIPVLVIAHLVFNFYSILIPRR